MKNKKDELNSLYGVASQRLIASRKFRKMGEIMTVVSENGIVLFGFDTLGRVVFPRPMRLGMYNYETLRKRIDEGKSWWERKTIKIVDEFREEHPNTGGEEQ